ncbi:MAG TPA: acetate--CoA ligase family protein, partial [Acetobacteraceae bacterium]|nr:acetate--CoA ligase family protein [Acetobacteraceae bacterium]
AEVAGRRAFASIAQVPAPPDVAILAVPVERLVSSVEEAARAGVGCCVIIATGFAEAGEDGEERQAALVRIAAESGMRIVGPNCMGLIVPHHRMALCSSVMLNTATLGDGKIALVSQSGALMVSIFDRAKTDGIGLRYGISLGNQSDLEICDFLEYLADEPGTAAICLYIEGLLDGARFRAAAARCRTAGKPVLAVKTGRTQAGVEAARSHTASLAGSFEAFAAICREQGVVLADDPDDMIRAAQYLIAYPGPRAPGVGVLSGSGGGTGIASDRLTELGMPLAQLRPETRTDLETMLFPLQAHNPIDLGGRRQGDDLEISDRTTRLLLADPGVGSGLIVLTSMPFFARRAGLIAAAARDCGKPVAIVVTPGAGADPARQAVRDAGMMCFDRFDAALNVLRLLADHDAVMRAPFATPARPATLPDPTTRPELPPGPQTEAAVKRLVAAYGLRVPGECWAASPEEAARAAEAIGFPVVLKAVSYEIMHKSDVGAVRLRLNDAESVTRAARDMMTQLHDTVPNAKIDGFSVQEMVHGAAEVIVGVRRDVQFGPIIMLGLGGIAVEILRDVALAPAPVSRTDVRRMIEGLRSAPLFFGARGRPPLDVEAIADAVERISWLALDLGETLVDLEINPLIVGATGGHAIAVDARATFREDSTRQSRIDADHR